MPNPALTFPPGVKWLFVDIDGTLWDHASASQRALRLACDLAEVDFDAFFPPFDIANRQGWRDLTAGRTTREQLRIGRFQSALQALGPHIEQRVDPDAMSRTYLSRYLDNVHEHVLPGAIRLLQSARSSGLRIALPTNGFRDTQVAKAHALGFHPDRGPIDFLWTPEDAGCLKPSTAFYERALQRAACPPIQALMIGDSPEDDIAPARQIGMNAWKIGPPEEEIPAFPSVNALAEALAIH